MLLTFLWWKRCFNPFIISLHLCLLNSWYLFLPLLRTAWPELPTTTSIRTTPKAYIMVLHYTLCWSLGSDCPVGGSRSYSSTCQHGHSRHTMNISLAPAIIPGGTDALCSCVNGVYWQVTTIYLFSMHLYIWDREWQANEINPVKYWDELPHVKHSGDRTLQKNHPLECHSKPCPIQHLIAVLQTQLLYKRLLKPKQVEEWQQPRQQRKWCPGGPLAKNSVKNAPIHKE